MSPPERTAPDPAEDFLISNPSQIAYLLARLRSSHAILSVRPAGSADAYASLVLDVDPGRNGAVMLDQLHPESGHRLVQPGALLRISARVDGVDAYWHGHVERVEEGPRGAVYRTAWPAVMEYRERRAVYRIAVPPGMKVPNSVFRGAAGGFPAQLVDLSGLGLGALALEPASLHIGDRIRASLALPEGQRLALNVQVRSTRPSHGHLRFGALHLDLTIEQQHTIERAVATMQRHWIQRYSSGQVA